jgi:hypothetical protein
MSPLTEKDELSMPSSDELLDQLLAQVLDHFDSLPPAERERAMQEFEKIGQKALARERHRQKRQIQRAKGGPEMKSARRPR